LCFNVCLNKIKFILNWGGNDFSDSITHLTECISIFTIEQKALEQLFKQYNNNKCTEDCTCNSIKNELKSIIDNYNDLIQKMTDKITKLQKQEEEKPPNPPEKLPNDTEIENPNIEDKKQDMNMLKFAILIAIVILILILILINIIKNEKI
jgi:chromatin remodeling complex protein RSC6